MSYSTYVGPYLKVENLGKKTVEGAERGCMNEDCAQYGRFSLGNFCPECGSEVGIVSVKAKVKVDIEDLIEDAGLDIDFFKVVELGKKRGSLLLYNKSQYYFDEDEGEREMDITEELVRKESYKFSNRKKIDKFMGYLEDNGISFVIRYGAVGFEE